MEGFCRDKTGIKCRDLAFEVPADKKECIAYGRSELEREPCGEGLVDHFYKHMPHMICSAYICIKHEKKLINGENGHRLKAKFAVYKKNNYNI